MCWIVSETKYAAGHDFPLCVHFVHSGFRDLDYCVFELCPSFGILRNTLQHSSVFSRIYPTMNKVQKPNNPVFLRIPDDEQSQKEKTVIPSVLHHH
jgi:hypothetical protein